MLYPSPTVYPGADLHPSQEEASSEVSRPFLSPGTKQSSAGAVQGQSANARLRDVARMALTAEASARSGVSPTSTKNLLVSQVAVAITQRSAYLSPTSDELRAQNTGPSVLGDWIGGYGADGYVLCNYRETGTDTATHVLPTGMTFSTSGMSGHSWIGDADSVDPRALQDPASPSVRRANAWYANPTGTATFTTTAGYAGNVWVYMLGWNTTSRGGTLTVAGQSVTVNGPDSYDGAWVGFPVDVPAAGSFTFTLQQTEANVPCISAIMLGGPLGFPAIRPFASIVRPQSATGTVTVTSAAPTFRIVMRSSATANQYAQSNTAATGASAALQASSTAASYPEES